MTHKFNKMLLITAAQRKKLLANGKELVKLMNGEIEDYNPKPVVRLFHPVQGATWLLAAIYPNSEKKFGCDLAYGLADLKNGVGAEGGDIPISGSPGFDLDSIVIMGMGVERDRYWKAKLTLREYHEKAQKTGGLD